MCGKLFFISFHLLLRWQCLEFTLGSLGKWFQFFKLRFIEKRGTSLLELNWTKNIDRFFFQMHGLHPHLGYRGVFLIINLHGFLKHDATKCHRSILIVGKILAILEIITHRVPHLAWPWSLTTSLLHYFLPKILFISNHNEPRNILFLVFNLKLFLYVLSTFRLYHKVCEHEIVRDLILQVLNLLLNWGCTLILERINLCVLFPLFNFLFD